MAGHSTIHPYFKSYDEITRTISRMKNYLSMFELTISNEEVKSVKDLIEVLEGTIQYIPEEFQVSRYKQFNKKD